VARKVGDCWRNADAVGKRRQRLARSGPSGTEVLGRAGIGTPAYSACTSLGLGHQVNEARCARDETSVPALSCVTDNACKRVQHSLKPVCYNRRRLDRDDIIAANPRGTTRKHRRVFSAAAVT